ncbi:PREDICTED: putative F-box protein At1g58310 [Brassica oleracea var. oleracea]|uniref:putative F-box protein At1g58310 n=1 Tax=Brassica oleracea var. oleracea TaxID=109376 RepID=UPI0006A6B5CD|nr:PREDICTED: putative F-box protein At1g58310 [Brassica oleracea var. oleracea]
MNLDFDDSISMHPGVRRQERDKIRSRFIRLVDSKLALHRNAPLNRLSIKCKDDVGPAPVIRWISKVLNRHVTELVLSISSHWSWPLSSEVDSSETMCQEFWESCSVSSITLKRLTFHTYPNVNFPLLVEASLDLRMTHEQIGQAKLSEDDIAKEKEGTMVGNATVLLMGICNVKKLYLSDNTLEVLAFCCKPMPVYNNLVHLTIKTHRDVEWKSLTALLKNCQNLETLVFDGLLHRYGMNCRSCECLCKPWEEEDVPTCLSSSPVKVLEILKFGDICEDEDMDKMMEQVEYFLETMPNLEQLIIHYETSIDEDVEEVLSQFQMVSREGLSKCKIQVISDNLNLSSST